MHPLFDESLLTNSILQILCLGIIGQDCTIVTPVNSGDTCTSITTAANITLATLLANNPNVNENCTNILIGEVSSLLFLSFTEMTDGG